ncbi:endonuclease/exonuclease/phosphatase family protein [Bosea sp. TND4EK4]|uniref:endonuclease/exonuclease/phosphatase family protein n=1 Tax=Bosea sp. TND4EK4 TaxID=1907408 RepID=UPI000953B613|nr:endonuclease/exonuclease/phosphatase family protein [Bosea sp. TND4EK4]SIQ25209.1 Endonuclease/Exonuclease/phosphatase family protein [Bosea sp. TND4EK4]
MKLRVGTFNVENLLTRHRFEQGGRTETAAAMSLFHFPRADERDAVERSLAVALEDDKRQMTALAMAEAQADLWMLQEVDSLASLQAFFANYVHRIADHRYGHFTLIDGNDRRNIDIAFAARRDLLGPGQVRAVSHKELSFAEAGLYDGDLAALGIPRHGKVFARDCLEIELEFGRRRLSLFGCHFKSMNNGREDGRQVTLPVRRAEARAVRFLIEQRFGHDWREANWIVLGDLNGYRHGLGPLAEPVDEGISGIEPLLDGFAVDPTRTLPAHERWTHFRRYWSEAQERLIDSHMPLDHILLSPALAAANPAPPIRMIRRGLPYRVPLDPRDPDRSMGKLATACDRYPRVGWDRPKASDHCPLTVDLTIP